MNKEISALGFFVVSKGINDYLVLDLLNLRSNEWRGTAMLRVPCPLRPVLPADRWGPKKGVDDQSGAYSSYASKSPSAVPMR